MKSIMYCAILLCSFIGHRSKISSSVLFWMLSASYNCGRVREWGREAMQKRSHPLRNWKLWRPRKWKHKKTLHIHSDFIKTQPGRRYVPYHKITELSAALHIRDYVQGLQLAGTQLTLWNKPMRRWQSDYQETDYLFTVFSNVTLHYILNQMALIHVLPA
jgi:hypothetical protein